MGQIIVQYPKAEFFHAVCVLGEVLRIHALQHPEIFVNLHAFAEVVGPLRAFRHLVRPQQSVVVEAFNVSALVRQTVQLLVGLGRTMGTLYSRNSKGTSLQRLRWFSGGHGGGGRCEGSRLAT